MMTSKCEKYSDHDWNLDIFPGECSKCGASYLDTWLEHTEHIDGEQTSELSGKTIPEMINSWSDDKFKGAKKDE